ncbi:Wadjet anti-phage system protein JetA family protein [Brevibacillus sedimenti]|uniref:Wadjet anti-phage system protein JetA family protein n=1 Tax=Brevibacillus sedimenti TaxID=2613334 RepID=UPI001E62D484|nr:Wadjet anti-phage system protein JetA family protein [Anoxybacillus sediminis]UFJ61298.1 hypothetical protein IRT44_19100 [Anoxybacillus sediminis]
MKLFDVVPDRFFHLLTGPNKHLYVEAALLLYEQSQRERFGIRYDVMRDLFHELIETYNELGVELMFDDEDIAEAKQEFREEQVTVDEYARTQANALIRKLASLKWIDVEVRDQFQQYIVLPHYTSRILSVLQELCVSRAVEYQRFAFVTYQLLTGEEAKRRPCFAIREAKQYTQQFVQELVTLYNNMKHHMEQVVQKSSIQDVLDHHFDKYKSEIVDKSYHRLKTSDHVSRYRFQILQTVQRWLLDNKLLEETIEDGLLSEFYRDRQEAEEDIRESLLYIEETYSGLDEIFYQIDLRHNQYLRSSYDRARYLSQYQQGINQRLVDLIQCLADSKKDEEFLWSQLFHMQSIAGITEQSLLPLRRKKPPHQPNVHVVVPIPDELKEELRRKNLERMRKAITRKKVEGYVLEKLGNRQELELQELAPTNIEEFLLLTYIYLYGQDGASQFQLKRNQERCILQIGDYRFDNHLVVRKGGR